MTLHYLTATAYRKAYKYEKLEVSNVKPVLVINLPLMLQTNGKEMKAVFSRLELTRACDIGRVRRSSVVPIFTFASRGPFPVRETVGWTTGTLKILGGRFVEPAATGWMGSKWWEKVRRTGPLLLNLRAVFRKKTKVLDFFCKTFHEQICALMYSSSSVSHKILTQNDTNKQYRRVAPAAGLRAGLAPWRAGWLIQVKPKDVSISTGTAEQQ